MRIIARSLCAVALSLLAYPVIAQTSPYQEEDYSRESVFGIFKTTQGGLISGVYYRSSKVLNANRGQWAHWAIEIANVKHPKETRQTSFSGNSFIFGKSNYLVSIRPTYGREKILFKKAPQQGVQISGLVSAGPTLGLQIPYYVKIDSRAVQFDPTNSSHSAFNIDGSSGIFKGIPESKIVLGLNLKASLTFQTNASKGKVFGVEAGFTFEAFTRKVEIVPAGEIKGTYTAAFLAIFFGKRR